MIRTTIGDFVTNHGLPKEFQQSGRVLDKKTLEKLLGEIAAKDPDKYRDAVQHLSRVGYFTAQLTGGHSFGPEHMRLSLAGKKAQAEIRRRVMAVYADPKLNDAAKEKAVIEILSNASEQLTKDVYNESLAEHNPLGMQILSGARGNPLNLRALRAGDLMYVDHRNRPIPIPILRSYSQGLSPVEYFAGTFGARKGVIDVKQGVRNAGFFGKQLVQAMHRLVVTANDREGDDPPSDSPRGYPTKIDDADNEGALLAMDAGPYKRNTILTPKILADLKDRGFERLLVRSPLVGGHPDGGIYARDAGVREKGTIAPVGDFIGISSGQALSEPVVQSGLCLARATSVRMADWSTKPIEMVEPGDYVLGADCEGRTFPVRVLARHANGLRECFRTSFRVGSSAKMQITVDATLDHKILAAVRKSSCKDEAFNGVLRKYALNHVGTHFTAAIVQPPQNKEAGLTYRRCRRVQQELLGCLETFDLEVDHPDHLFVLANGLIVSNSSKHSGGVAAARSLVGFDALNALVQVPKTFKGGAAHAQRDGRVTSIREAPQGGHYVTIGGEDHYVGHGYAVKVKEGQEIEAGDVLSEGLPNPSEAVKHKGIGEGSRYFVDTFVQACKDSGIRAHRRNVELLARGLINHVELDDEWEENIPGDIVSYRRMEHKYKPREGHQVVPVAKAKDQYLEAPVLHYSIGTRVRPSVVQTLTDYGVKNVSVHKDPPPFKPVMIRGMENVAHDSDWMTRFLGSYLKKNFLGGVHRGDVSDEASTSYVPSLARTVDFGKAGPVRGWQPAGPPPKAPAPAPSIMAQINEPAPEDPLKGMFTTGKVAAARSDEEHPFAAFVVEYPAGTHRILVDDDDEDDESAGYPLREITYPVDYGSVPGYVGEDDADLDLLHGRTPDGESGSFVVRRYEPFKTETKFYYQASPFQKDQILRAFAPVLAARPTIYKDDAELRQALKKFARKK